MNIYIYFKSMRIFQRAYALFNSGKFSSVTINNYIYIYFNIYINISIYIRSVE